MRSILLFITALLTSTVLLAQTADEALQLEGYAKNIAQFNRNNPQEKVYLHMDNRSYFIGDTIFFKAYVLNASTLQRTKVSEVLYVELLNESGIEMEHKKLKVVGGVCHGSFILKDSYRTGYYEIRAYTRYMLNFGNEKMPWMNIHKHVKATHDNKQAYLGKRIPHPHMGPKHRCRRQPLPVYPSLPRIHEAREAWRV